MSDLSEANCCGVGYEHAQAFAGGALAVNAGTGKLVKGKKLFSNPAFKKAETFLKYGIQSTAYDFAYTEQKYFVGKYGRKWYEHVGMFASGGLSAMGAESYFTGKGSELLNSNARIGLGAGIYAAEWSITSLIKQRSYARYNGYPQGGFYTGSSQQAKGWILGFKWLDSSRNIFLGK